MTIRSHLGLPEIAPDADRADDWRSSASCLGCYDHHPDVPTAAEYAPSRGMCAACPVLAECRAWVLDAEGNAPESARHGVAGGLDPAERASIARRLARDERAGRAGR